MPGPLFIVWKDSYSVGCAELDQHHQGVIAIINDLYAAIQKQKGAEKVNEILERLYAYTQFHFKREEELMAEGQFPGLPGHKAVHERMVRRTDKLRRQNLGHEGSASREAMSFLKEWWLNHILAMDMQYKPHLAQEKS